MRRKIIVYTAAVTVLITALGILGGVVIHKVEAEEVRRVENIAGAVVSAYPQAEEAFAESVMDGQLKYRSEGAEIMSHYGYDEDMALSRRYGRLLNIYIALMALIFAAALGAGYFAFFYTKNKRNKQEELVLAMLDDCISGDYAFVKDDSLLSMVENQHFADTLVKLAESLRLKTERLDAEQDSTKELVTDISHQLKTPISAMRVCFDMYLEAESEEEKEEFLSRSMVQMDKLESLAAALINISRLEKKMIMLHCENVSLTDILIGAVNTIYHNAAAKRIDIDVGEFEAVELYMDRKWTVEAIANILDNGVKYSPKGSRISIEVQRLFSFVRVEISDEGIGIPRSERNRIFQRFFRGSSETVKAQEGSGVGLYLSRRIIEEQGGTISVRPGAKGGSVFVVQLPL